MPAAPIPPDEPERLTALRSLDLLDGSHDQAMERIAALARSLFSARSGNVTLVEADRVLFKSKAGKAFGEVARGGAFSAHVILEAGVLWVEDAQQDARFAGHPDVVGGPGIRLCAGAPIVSPEGFRLGAVCVFDPEPRAFHQGLADHLAALAEIVADHCRLGQARAHLRRSSDAQAAADQSIRDFIQQAPLGIVLTDRDLRVVQASPRFLADYGETGAQFVGRSVRDFLPDTSRIDEVAARCLAGERVVGEAAYYVTVDGRSVARDWEAAPWRDRAGEIVGVILLTNDVTELYLSRGEARRAQDRLTRALHISDTIVWELNLAKGDMHITGDPSIFYDRPPTQDDIRRDPLCTVHPEDRPAVEEAWRELMAGGASYRAEHRTARQDGRDVWVAAAADLFRDKMGRPARIIGVTKDITYRKRQELALAAARVEAEAADRAKSEFLANMSHEIRTPLNGVVGVAGALKRTPLAPAQQEMVKLIENSGRVLERLLADVLDLARVEADGVQMRAEPFDPAQLAREVCALFEPETRDKGLSFRLQLPTAPSCVVGDPLRVRQVLSNLCSNAVKFTDRGEIGVTVTSQTRPDGLVALRVEVRDTGIGFDASIKGRLFERFQQADGSITRRYGGSGLGLAISRGLAEGMGGRLDAQSEPGHGSVFTFAVALPQATSEEPLADLTTAEAAPERALRVLLAEDHEINRHVVQLILGAAGVDLTLTCDGAEAVRAAEADRFDLILMDMQMPVMDGLSAIRAIRALERRRRLPRTPIVALTANALPEHQAASREAGADDHMTKPIVADTLLALVSRMAFPDEASGEPMRLSA